MAPPSSSPDLCSHGRGGGGPPLLCSSLTSDYDCKLSCVRPEADYEGGDGHMWTAHLRNTHEWTTVLLSVGIVVVILFVMLAMSLFCQAMGNFGWDAILEAAGRRLAAGAPAGAPNSGEAAASSPPAYEELFPEAPPPDYEQVVDQEEEAASASDGGTSGLRNDTAPQESAASSWP